MTNVILSISVEMSGRCGSVIICLCLRDNVMASVLGRIDSCNPSLTPSEMKVATYLTENTEKAIASSIHEVARNSNVSVASVSRLAATLGFRDWKDLRLNLVKDASNATRSAFSDIESRDSDEAVIKKIFDCSMLSLNDTFKQIDANSVVNVAEAIERAGRIAFFGTGRSGCFAAEEALRFAHLNPATGAYSDEYQMVLHSSWLAEGDIAFGFSNSGRSHSTISALETARKNNALTIGIANYRNTPLEAASDIYFCTSFPRVGEISSSLTARIALLCIMDSIYVLVSTRGKLGGKADVLDKDIDKRLRIMARKRASNGKPANGS